MTPQDKGNLSFILIFLEDTEFPHFILKPGDYWVCFEKTGTGKAYLEAVEKGEKSFLFSNIPCPVKNVRKAGIEDIAEMKG